MNAKLRTIKTSTNIFAIEYGHWTLDADTVLHAKPEKVTRFVYVRLLTFARQFRFSHIYYMVCWLTRNTTVVYNSLSRSLRNLRVSFPCSAYRVHCIVECLRFASCPDQSYIRTFCFASSVSTLQSTALKWWWSGGMNNGINWNAHVWMKNEHLGQSTERTANELWHWTLNRWWLDDDNTVIKSFRFHFLAVASPWCDRLMADLRIWPELECRT